ncbi:MAG: DnaB-like helicase C-terminal domain-containing protein, partial [Clostridia bacterium]
MAEYDGIRQMPYSLEAEQAVLGAVIIDAALLDDAIFLKTNDFYLEQHRLIFQSIKELFNENKKLDIVTLINKIVSSNSKTEFDVPKYMKMLCDMSVSNRNIKEYIAIIHDKAILRALISASSDISDRAFSQGENVAGTVDYAEQKIYDISGENINSSFTHIKDILVDNFNRFQFIAQNPDLIEGVKTNFSTLDNYFVSLGPGDLVIVGARPGVGKTTFCHNIAANVGKAYSNGEIAVFSLEMSKESLVNRILCSEATIDNYTLRKAKFTERDWDELARASSTLSRTQIMIDDTANTSTTEMKAKLRRLKNLKLVIIDYLQLITCDRYSENKVL